MEGEAEVIFVDDFRGNFAVNDFLEDSHGWVSGGWPGLLWEEGTLAGILGNSNGGGLVC
jgi:hypothetical protein